ncbi:hypothetical protein EW145_g2141 [Phellinidium pouzarii]|uniref:Retrotransposon gag domain-containing protein n=1 Tax=Phellinidium pouzarii TaxID=167371 RepID=A0A4S4LC81_9AGAM|nr:hypothetical protein EW145_g2141 [Phellinidium pouzarii]
MAQLPAPTTRLTRCSTWNHQYKVFEDTTRGETQYYSWEQTQPNQPPHWFYLTNDPEDAAIHFEIAIPNYHEIFEETCTPNLSPIQLTIELPTPPVSNTQQQQPQSTPLPHAPSTSTTSSHIPLSPQPAPTPLVNMSTPAPIGEACISKPNNFDGDKGYARCFLSSCEAYLSLNEQVYNTNKRKIIFVLSFMLEKAAGDWATNCTTIALAPNPITNTPTGFGTWQNFVNNFRNTFITTDDSANAQCQLLNIKQTGTADDYNTQFRSLVTHSNISDKNTHSEMYQQGLTRSLIQHIYARDKLPDTMEEWYQAASRADNLYRRLQALNATEVFKEKLAQPSVFGDLERALEILKTKSIVHGDLRMANIIVDPEKKHAKVVDFDWAGKSGEARYPPMINKKGLHAEWHVGIKPGGIMQISHDEVAVRRLPWELAF